MSGSNTEFLVHNNNRAHGLQLLIKREAFDAYFTHSGDNSDNLNRLSHLLDPAHFKGSMQMDSRLIMALMQLPRHACDDELDIYHIKGYIYNILSLFLQQLLNPAVGAFMGSLAGLGRLIEVNEEIAGKLEEEHPSLEEAARRSCMCSTKFKKLFRLAYDTTYHKYHQKVKLQRARELFQTSNTSVMAVVRDLGYKNAGHFARMFKELFRISPKEYQKQFDAIV
jgi:AraC-like DNA-binding protein